MVSEGARPWGRGRFEFANIIIRKSKRHPNASISLVRRRLTKLISEFSALRVPKTLAFAFGSRSRSKLSRSDPCCVDFGRKTPKV